MPKKAASAVPTAQAGQVGNEVAVERLCFRRAAELHELVESDLEARVFVRRCWLSAERRYLMRVQTCRC
jgi:hypothetical protein